MTLSEFLIKARRNLKSSAFLVFLGKVTFLGAKIPKTLGCPFLELFSYLPSIVIVSCLPLSIENSEART